jgi:hypothetical protein
LLRGGDGVAAQLIGSMTRDSIFWFGIQEPVCGNRHLKGNAELRAAVILDGKEIES